MKPGSLRRPGGRVAPLSPVYWAGASLKHDTTCAGRVGLAAFPGLLGRGLIEAFLARPGRKPSTALSPVYWAGASLKLPHRGGEAAGLEGLSPVYWAGASLKQLPPQTRHGGLRAFPGLLGRGLIEASCRSRRRRPARCLSPVYWAGASLKLASLSLGTPALVAAFPGLLGRGLIEARSRMDSSKRARTCLSPVYWAGASLKPRTQFTEAPDADFFPRSTGPGPH